MADQKLRLIITGDVTQAEKALRSFERRVDKTARTLGRIGDTMTRYVTLPILAVGAAATKMAIDAVESENLFEVSLGKMAKAARKWSDDLSKTLGLNAYEVRKYLGTFDVMLGSFGLGEEKALSLSEGLTKLAYDMASFYNLNVEDAFEKLQSGISGEIEPLRRLGIIVNETTTKTYAYTHGIAKNGAVLTEQQKILARYGVIMEATSKAQGDLARTADSPANQLRRLQATATQLGITYGTVLIPAMQELIRLGGNLATTLNGMTEGEKKTIVYIAAFAAAVGPVVKVIEALVKVVGWATSAFVKLKGVVFALEAGVTGLINALVALPFAFGAVVNWFDRDRIAAKQAADANYRLKLQTQGVAVALHQGAHAASSYAADLSALNRQLSRTFPGGSVYTRPRAVGGFNPGVPSMSLWGEDGPEYTIPTSPKYRAQALSLTSALMRDLGTTNNYTMNFPVQAGSSIPAAKQHVGYAWSQVMQAPVIPAV